MAHRVFTSSSLCGTIVIGKQPDNMTDNMNTDHIKAYHEAAGNRPAEGYEVPAQVAEFLSDESVEVMCHFGLEAPKLLNNYSCALEDALIEQVQRANNAESANRVINEILEENGVDLRAMLEKAREEELSA